MKKMIESEFRQLMRDVFDDMVSDGLNIDDCAYDVAECLMYGNDRLVEYAKAHLNEVSHDSIRLFIAEAIG